MGVEVEVEAWAGWEEGRGGEGHLFDRGWGWCLFGNFRYLIFPISYTLLVSTLDLAQADRPSKVC